MVNKWEPLPRQYFQYFHASAYPMDEDGANVFRVGMLTAELTRLNTDIVIIYKADDFHLHALPVT